MMKKEKIRVAFDRPDFVLDVCADGIAVSQKGIDLCVLTPCAAVEKLVHEGEPNDWPALEDVDQGEFAFAEVSEGGVRRFTWTGRSSNWEKKEYCLECDREGYNFFVRVTGEGYVGEIRYFDCARAGEAVSPVSQYGFCEYYVPTCDTFGKELNYYPSSQSYRSYFELMVPPMYCFAFRTEDLEDWLGLGLLAKPGNYNFIRYDYNLVRRGRYCGFSVSTNMEGHQAVGGVWEAPFIRGFMGSDERDVVARYSAYHYDTGLAVGWKPPVQPRWWLGPVYCGWSEQEFYAERLGGFQAGQAAQEPYEDMVSRLDARGLRPAYIIIDDKWQDRYGTAMPDPEKWRDMRGFVDQMHARGVRVLLWFRLWGGEGLPVEETMPGDPVKPWNKDENERYADPSSPAYQQRLREIIRVLLSDEAGCMNCDGFKLDFAFWMPYGRRAVSHSGQYGVELLKSLFTQIYTRAKEVKPDALINCSPCHPYFSENCDQLRLHDYDGSVRRNVMEVMGDRRWLFTTACRGQSVDTDNVGFFDRRDTMKYLRRCRELGIPDLYQLSDPRTFAMTDADWEEVRQLWEDYSREMDEKYAAE